MKLTTKLLLGATVVAGLSVSAFAACANDVDFGGTKKITGLADGTATGEAVHYGQLQNAIRETVVFEEALQCDNTEKTFSNALGNGLIRIVFPGGSGYVNQSFFKYQNTVYNHINYGFDVTYNLDANTSNLVGANTIAINLVNNTYVCNGNRQGSVLRRMDMN